MFCEDFFFAFKGSLFCLRLLTAAGVIISLGLGQTGDDSVNENDFYSSPRSYRLLLSASEKLENSSEEDEEEEEEDEETSLSSGSL